MAITTREDFAQYMTALEFVVMQENIMLRSVEYWRKYVVE